MKKSVYEIQDIPGMGRGVVATEDIPKDTVVMVNHVLTLSNTTTALLTEYNCLDLMSYTFKYDMDSDCLCLGEGELFNHSDDNNVVYVLNKDNNTMTFKAARDIKAGEQLFINYKQDDPNIDMSIYGL